MTIHIVSGQVTVPQLISVGDDAWVARDPSLPDDDARRLIAYVEHADDRVHVLWVRDRRDVSVYDSLAEAMKQMGEACEIARIRRESGR